MTMANDTFCVLFSGAELGGEIFDLDTLSPEPRDNIPGLNKVAARTGFGYPTSSCINHATQQRGSSPPSNG
jgi:hypothetical protein